MKILLIGEAAGHRDDLAEHLDGDHEIVTLPREAAFSAEHDAAIGPDDVVVSLRFSRPPDRETDFRLLHVPGAGLDAIQFDSVPADALLCNVFEHEIPIAEYTMGCLLEFEIGAAEMRRTFRADNWPENYRARIPHGEVFGKTLGLIGYGRVGRAIAERAAAFGIRVVVMDQMTPDDSRLASTFTPEQLPLMLAECDYIVVACPLTNQTQDLIDTAAFAQMKPTAALINISRAQVVNEAALYAALTHDQIAAAFLDVWYRYPTGTTDRTAPSEFDFVTLPNAWCTPHSSAWTANLSKRRYRFIAENINRLTSGAALLNVVDRGANG